MDRGGGGAGATSRPAPPPRAGAAFRHIPTSGDFNFSPDVSWANLVQYDNESRLFGFQGRFRWILKPGSDLFVVLNRGWYCTLDHRFLSTFDRGTVKLAYTFRF